MQAEFYRDEIEAVRSKGGDVIISFGGAAGSSLATAAVRNKKTLDELANMYKSVIETYNITYIDFDVEGADIANQPSYQLRHGALSLLQQWYPQLIVSFTLPTLPSGIDAHAKLLLGDALRWGLRLKTVRLMTFNYGAYFHTGLNMAELAISACSETAKYIQSVGLAAKVQPIVMIGQADVPDEVTDVEQASIIVGFCQASLVIDGISIWSLNRDVESTEVKANAYGGGSGLVQPRFGFSRIMRQVES